MIVVSYFNYYMKKKSKFFNIVKIGFLDIFLRHIFNTLLASNKVYLMINAIFMRERNKDEKSHTLCRELCVIALYIVSE
jgi:hypothetical protein